MMEIKDAVFRRILGKFQQDIYTMGNKTDFPRYYIEGKNIHDFPFNQRTPEICAALMHYSRCKLHDVPNKSRTREFYIDTFTDKDVNDFIKMNIELFDRDFFKDLIVTNNYSTHFDTNCFNVMPLEYIDDEMISLAILHTQDWSSDEWFMSVVRRKKEAISSDVWKLAARLYGRMSGYSNRIVDNAPEEVKDEEFYRELCLCNFNAGMSLDTNKGKVMDLVPEEMLTSNFIVSLLNDNLNNVCRFNETGLNMVVPCSDGREVVVWKYVIERDGYLIQYLPLNQERIDYFISLYPKNSHEYRISFKDVYKKYLREQENPKKEEQLRYREQAKTRDLAEELLMHAFLFSMEGENPDKAIDIVNNRNKVDTDVMLPIRFRGLVPEEYELTHDSEEYLEMIYKKYGIEILDQEDSFFYRVRLPEGWVVTGEGYHYAVVNQDNEEVINYFYCSKFYDMDAYVTDIKNPEDIKKKTL